MNKKIISFCLWGNNPKYTIGAIKNAKLTNEIYSGWISRFYCSKSVPEDIINQLKSIDNCEVVLMDEDGDWNGMFWRFLPASESNISVMISRDCDSRLSLREKLAVDEWLNSDKNFHIMRDHPCHGIEILGGMWGVKYPYLNDMKNHINNFDKGNFWQIDQIFLKNIIYPIIKDDIYVHDEFFAFNKNANNFPSNREDLMFVGEIFDENDNPIMEHRNMLKK